MSLCRLRSRTPTAYTVGVFFLNQHKLKFHKIGKDGSAKCNAHFTGAEADIIEGVVFELDPDEVAELDRAEGLGNGYEKKNVKVTDILGNTVEAFSYFATKTNDSLLPFSWYTKHVLKGAESAGLSDGYIAQIEAVQTINDPDGLREQRELIIYRR